MQPRDVSPDAWSLYERLVAAGGLPLNGPGCDLSDSDTAVRELIAAGYARATVEREGVKKIAAISPLAVYERLLVSYREARLERERTLSHIREVAFAFHLEEVRSHRLLGARTAAAIVHDRLDVELVVGQVMDTAMESADSWNTGPYATATPNHPPDVEAVVPRADAIASGARIRTVFSRDVTETADDRAVVDASAEAGEDVRVADRLPMKLMIGDHRVAVVPLKPRGAPALVVRDAGVVRLMECFFDLIWAQASPWRQASETDAGQSSRSRRREVLGLLADGHKDEAIARHLRLSVRTVRRHITEMMTELGTSNRFAAGVAAVRAGWFDSP